jgi:hypothetical protein
VRGETSETGVYKGKAELQERQRVLLRNPPSRIFLLREVAVAKKVAFSDFGLECEALRHAMLKPENG